MYLSELLKYSPDKDVSDILNEKEFDRFSRTTSDSEGRLCIYVASLQYIKTIPDNTTMIITTEEIAKKTNLDHAGLCISASPKATFFRAFVSAAERSQSEKNPTVIGENCCIGKLTSISEYNVKIGNNVIVEDFATIYDGVEIGDNCIIRSGARIGVQDYNYYLDRNRLIHLPHYGKLIIEDDVEIGFNTVVGKSLYPGDVTLIGRGSKLAHSCGVGHDCKIGQNVLIYAGTMIAGFVEIGDNTHVTLNSSIKNAITIGESVQIDMGSVVIRDIPDGQTVFGNPARRIITPGN